MKNVPELPALFPEARQVWKSCSTERAIGPVDAMISLLDQLSDVIGQLSDEQYTAKPVGVVPSSIGAHVRHCLDHVSTLLSSGQDPLLDYDRRERGTDVENRRYAAVAAIDVLRSRLAKITQDTMYQLLQVRLRMAIDSDPIVVMSSFGRELAYVLSHTIHHNAMVGGMVKTLGVMPPETFGFAPSTLHAARVAKACA